MSQDTLHTVGKANLAANIAAYPRWEDAPEMNAFWSRPLYQGGGNIVAFWQDRVWARGKSAGGLIYAFDGKTWYLAATVAGDNLLDIWFLDRSTTPTAIALIVNNAGDTWTLERFTLASDGTLTADGGNPVLTINSQIGGFGGSSLRRGIVECGTDEVVYAEYGQRLYGSLDAGASWSLTLTSYYTGDEDRAIRHFHGGHYDVTNSMLYIFAGDSAGEAGILLCDDVADLLLGDGSWSTDWRANWGLEDAARTGLDVGYVLNDDITGTLSTTRDYRTVDGRIMTDSVDARWFVWGEDNALVGGTRFWRQAIPTSLPLSATRSKIQIGDSVNGIGWYGVTLESGTLVFNTYSDRSGAAYNDGSDAYVRLIAIRPDLSGWDLLRRWKRSDWEAPGSSIDVEAEHLVEVYGHLILQVNVTGGNDPGLELPAENTAWGRIVEAPDRAASPPDVWKYELAAASPAPQLCNLLGGGVFTASDTEPTGYWDEANLDGASGIDNSVRRSPGQYGTLKLVGDGTNTYSKAAKQYLGGTAAQSKSRVSRQLAGRWVTLRTAIKLPAALDAPSLSMKPGVYLTYNAAGQAISHRFTEADFDDEWHEVILTALVYPGVNYLSVHLEAAATGDDPTGTPLPAVYFDDVVLVAGHMPGGRSLTDLSLITTQTA